MLEFLGSKLFWALIAIVLLAYFYIKYYIYSYWQRHGIPHEPPSIPLGNVPLSYFFGKIALSNLLKELHDKFKEYRFHGVYILNRPVIMINDPDLIKIVLVKEFWKFADRGWFANAKVDQMLDNLFLQPPGRWKIFRQKFTPTFTPGKLRQIHPLMREIGDEMVKAVDAELKTSSTLEMKDIIARYTTDIISSVVYGFNCNSLSNPNNDFRRYGLRTFEFGRINMLIAVFLPEILEKISLPFYHKEVRDFFTKIFSETVDLRRRENVARKDFMNLLIQLIEKGQVEDNEKTSSSSEDDNERISIMEAAAQAFVFFNAGFETSSSTASYCLLELCVNQEIQEKLQQDIDRVAESPEGFTFDNIMEMEYLEMVFSETLRKYPSVAFLNRICTEDFKIPGTNFTIPKGMRIVISPPGIQRNPKFFPDPEKFDPSRFTKDNLAKRSPYVHLGFGEGPRNCIGKRFGTLQTKQALVSMLYNYRFRICDQTILPVRYETEGFVQSSIDGIHLRVERRR